MNSSVNSSSTEGEEQGQELGQHVQRGLQLTETPSFVRHLSVVCPFVALKCHRPSVTGHWCGKMATAKSFQDLEVWKLGRDLRGSSMKSPKVCQRMNGIISPLRSKQQPFPSHPTLQKDLGGIITRRICNSAASPEAPPASSSIISRHA